MCIILAWGIYIFVEVVFSCFSRVTQRSLHTLFLTVRLSWWLLIHAEWLMIPICTSCLAHDPWAESYLSQAAPPWPGWTLAFRRRTPSAQTAGSKLRYPAELLHPTPSSRSGGCGAEGSQSRPSPASPPLLLPLPAACAPLHTLGNSGTKWPGRDRKDNCHDRKDYFEVSHQQQFIVERNNLLLKLLFECKEHAL